MYELLKRKKKHCKFFVVNWVGWVRVIRFLSSFLFPQVHPNHTLPSLYLMDSIMKNIGGEYVDLFSRNIVQLFCKSFEKLVCLYMCINWKYYMRAWENVLVYSFRDPSGGECYHGDWLGGGCTTPWVFEESKSKNYMYKTKGFKDDSCGTCAPRQPGCCNTVHVTVRQLDYWLG